VLCGSIFLQRFFFNGDTPQSDLTPSSDHDNHCNPALETPERLIAALSASALSCCIYCGMLIRDESAAASFSTPCHSTADFADREGS